MANDPKIDCRVRLVRSVLNTNLQSWNEYATEFSFTYQRDVAEEFGDACDGETPD